MAAISSYNNNIHFYSVGGDRHNREKRSCLLGKLLKVNLHNYAKEDPSYEDGKFFIPNHIPDEYVNATFKKINLQERDIIILIGHIQTDEFIQMIENKVKNMNSRELESFTSNLDIWVQGPGFNCDQKLIDYLRGRNITVKNISQENCPSFSPEEWKELLDLYPDELKQMRDFQVGGFWLSRNIRFTHNRRSGIPFITSAFYNQWGLNEIVNPNNNIDPSENLIIFESHIWNQAKQFLSPSLLRAVGSEFDNFFLSLDSKDSVEETWSKIYGFYNHYNEYFQIHKNEFYPSFTKAIIMNISSIGNKLSSLNELEGITFMRGCESKGIKEYDSFVTHVAITGSIPTKEEHYNMIYSCLKYNNFRRDHIGEQVLIYDSKILEFIGKVRDCVRDRRIICMHDLGLDPQSDDWLAIEMLTSVFVRSI